MIDLVYMCECAIHRSDAMKTANDIFVWSRNELENTDEIEEAQLLTFGDIYDAIQEGIDNEEIYIVGITKSDPPETLYSITEDCQRALEEVGY